MIPETWKHGISGSVTSTIKHKFVSQPLKTLSLTIGYLMHADICGHMAHVSVGGAP